MPSFTPIHSKMDLVASVRIRKFTHMGRIKSSTSIFPLSVLLRMYAMGYPSSRQSRVVTNPTIRLTASTSRLLLSEKKSTKLSSVSFPSARKALTKTMTSGVTIKSSMNSM